MLWPFYSIVGKLMGCLTSLLLDFANHVSIASNIDNVSLRRHRIDSQNHLSLFIRFNDFVIIEQSFLRDDNCGWPFQDSFFSQSIKLFLSLVTGESRWKNNLNKRSRFCILIEGESFSLASLKGIWRTCGRFFFCCPLPFSLRGPPVYVWCKKKLCHLPTWP